MSIPDEAFREEFKPLHIPAHYIADDSEQNKIVYALAQIGEGTAGEVSFELAKTDTSINAERYGVIAESLLNSLFEKGLIKGVEKEGVMHYDLSKITKANEGGVNPDLLAPGLD